MDGSDKAALTEAHLREVWETLLRERQRGLARLVEGVLAELTDETQDVPSRLAGAARMWKTLLANPRGLPDFGIWREDGAERIRLNLEFERRLDKVSALLA